MLPHMIQKSHLEFELPRFQAALEVHARNALLHFPQEFLLTKPLFNLNEAFFLSKIITEKKNLGIINISNP